MRALCVDRAGQGCIEAKYRPGHMCVDVCVVRCSCVGAKYRPGLMQFEFVHALNFPLTKRNLLLPCSVRSDTD